MLRILLIVLLGSTFFVHSYSQVYYADIKWYTIDGALKLQKEKPGKLLVEVYTKWSKVCHKLDQLSLSQQHIADYINSNYYPVKLGAESRAPIYYMGQKDEWKN